MNVYLLGVHIVFQFFLLCTIVHEYGHLITLRLLGYEGCIYSHSLTRTYGIGELLTPADYWLFGLGGGVFQFLVFGFMSLINRGEGRLVNRMVAVQGLVYAVFEAYDLFFEGAFVSILVAFAYLTWWLLSQKQE